MNRLLLIALAASIGISACSKKEEAAAPAGSATPPALAAATPNTGKVLQVLQAAGYTYAEVDTQGGQKIWIAGGPLQVKPGDSVQWGSYAVMENFNSKTLGRTFDQILFVNAWGPVGGATAQVAPHGNSPVHPAATAAISTPEQQAAAGSGANQGEVKSVANAAGYTYVEVNQAGTTVWVAAPETSVKPGDKVRWDNGTVMRHFTAKSLGRTFDQIIFASKVAVVR